MADTEDFNTVQRRLPIDHDMRAARVYPHRRIDLHSQPREPRVGGEPLKARDESREIGLSSRHAKQSSPVPINADKIGLRSPRQPIGNRSICL